MEDESKLDEDISKLDEEPKQKTEPHWQSRRSLVIIWHTQIKNASIARTKGNNNEYFRAVDSIIPITFKEDRIKIKAWIDYNKNCDCSKLVFYDSLLEYIIDVLEPYLKIEFKAYFDDETLHGDQDLVRGGEIDGS